MAQMMYRDAVLTTIAEEMERDSTVVVLGEDVVTELVTPPFAGRLPTPAVI